MEGKGESLKKSLTTNLGLKILAIIFAILLWLIVVNINDPIMTQTYSGVQVEVLNKEAITGEGKIFEVMDNTNIISVTITAKRSVLAAISKDNIKATADMEELTFMDTIGIKLTSDKYADKIESIKSATENLKVNIENMKKAQLVIQVKTTGKPEKGYLIGDVATDQTVVRLSGPESVISTVSSAEATVDVEGMTTDISTSVDVKLFDKDGNAINNSSIVKNIDSVSVDVEILGTKTVPLEYTIMGTPSEGYALTGVVTSSPAEILITGKKNILDVTDKIVVPENAVNVTGQSGDLTVIVDLTKYIPDNIELADTSFNGIATVVVYIEKQVSKSAVVTTDNLAITNIPEGYNIVLADDESPIDISLYGLTEAMDSIDFDSIKGTIDMTEFLSNHGLEVLSEGYFDANIELVLPENVQEVEQVKTVVHITKK